MNNSIKKISKLLAFLLKITSIAVIIGVVVFTIIDYKYITGAHSFNDYEVLGFAFTLPFVIIFMFFRIVNGVIIFIEMVTKELWTRSVRKLKPHELDRGYKIKGEIGVFLSGLILLVMIILAVTGSDNIIMETAFSTQASFVFIFVYVIYNRWLARGHLTVSIVYLTSSSGLDNVFMFDISDYLSKLRKGREELEFYLNIFEKHNILNTCNTAGEEMIWSTCYKCNYQGVPFTMAYDNEYDMVSFSVDENNISQRRFVAEGIKELIEQE